VKDFNDFIARELEREQMKQQGPQPKEDKHYQATTLQFGQEDRIQSQS